MQLPEQHKPTPLRKNAVSRSHDLRDAVAKVIQRELRRTDLLETYVKHHLPDRELWLAGQDDHRFKEHCEQLLALHAVLTAGDDRPCADTHVPFVRGGPLLPAVRLMPLGKKILACCQAYAADNHWGVVWANHVFHPAVTVMLRAMKRYAMKINQCQVSDSGISLEPALGDLMGHVTRFVRRACGTWRYINATNAHNTKEKDNFDSAREFIYHLAGQHTRLCFLRIDLTFRTAWKDFSHSEAADKAVKDFLRSLRSKACKRNLLPGYLGFIIKRENGISRGTHFHVLVVLNGNLQGKSSHSVDYLSDALCKMWLQRIGPDRGSAHNSYKDRNFWLFNGLGLQDFTQVEALAGLRYALHYLTKQDCVLKTSNDKIKNFWRTPTPRATTKKRGPKRKRLDHLTLLYRMLGGARSPYPPGFDPKPYVLAKKRLAISTTNRIPQ